MKSVSTVCVRGTKHIHTVAQPPPPSVSRTRSSSQTETRSLLTSEPPSSLPQPLAPPLYFLSVKSTTLGNLVHVVGQCLSFRDWLIPLSVTSSRFIHALAGTSSLLLFRAE